MYYDYQVISKIFIMKLLITTQKVVIIELGFEHVS